MIARATTVLLATSVLCVPTAARADAARLRVDYQGDDACPSAEAFLDAVRQRLPDVSLVGPGEPATFVQVSAARASEGPAAFLGRVAFYRAEGRDAERQVEGASCEEVIVALALIVSVYVRSSADGGSDSSETTSEASPARPDARGPSPVTARGGGWRGWAGVGGGARAGVAEGLAPELFVTGGLLLDRAGMVAPSVRLRVGYAWGHAVLERTDEEVSIRHFSVGLEGCPLTLRLSARWLQLVPCARVEAGLHSAGLESEPSGMGSWLAGGPLLEARSELARHFVVALGGGVLFPAFRNEFVARTVPEEALFETPAATFETWASAGLFF